MILDWTFTTRTDVKGTYRRRIKDIDDAFRAFGAVEKDSAAELLVNYFACEKLAKAIVGIAKEKSAASMDKPGMYAAATIAATAANLNLQFDGFEALFGTDGEKAKVPKTARLIRNRIFHNFGPTNVGHAIRNSPTFMPMMIRFLGLSRSVFSHLETLNKTRSIAPPPSEAIKVRKS